MIRHGEKPPKVGGNDVDGLSIQGVERSQGLCQVFGANSQYNIGHILAEHPKKSDFLPAHETVKCEWILDRFIRVFAFLVDLLGKSQL
jgi:hypothetical protein